VRPRVNLIEIFARSTVHAGAALRKSFFDPRRTHYASALLRAALLQSARNAEQPG
jgi:hypothetical protein